MKELRTLTENPQKRQEIVSDCIALVDAEVKSKKGFSGAAVKTVYKLVKALKPNMMQNLVDGLLDDFTVVLQRFYSGFQNEGEPGTLEQHFADRSQDVAEGLLTVTDERARNNKNKTLVKGYNKLRPKGKEHVAIAAPGVGRILDKHVTEL